MFSSGTLDPIITTESDLGDWYGSTNKAQNGLEVGNSNRVTIAVVSNSAGNHIAVVYDEDPPADTSGGSLVATITCNGGSCNFEHNNNDDTTNGNVITFDWPNGGTGGFVVGPFTTTTIFCLDHSSMDTMGNGAVYETGSGSETSLASTSQLESSQLCVTIF